VKVDARGRIVVTDFYNDRVQVFAPSGRVLATWGSKGTGRGQLDGPTDLALDRRGDVYVSDFNNNRVQEFSPAGRVIAIWDGNRIGFAHPHGLAVDQEGNLYLTDYTNNQVLKLSPAGRVLVKWGGPGRGPEQFDRPSSVAVGGRAHVYVADSGSARVREFAVR
jgi:DNA-binding beta-propeller fold protein YncE